jgi:hypothetical protein
MLGRKLMASLNRKRRFVLGLMVAELGLTVAARFRGYSVGGKTIVRCRAGHLFTTLWIPLASVKSIRLGWWRIQRCPVGSHWTIVSPVKASDLTEDERRTARAIADIPVP